MVDTEIFRAGNELPPNIDGFSAPPKGFNHFIDNSKDGTEWMKKILTANFKIEDVFVFHEEGSDIGGKMIIRFFYNGSKVELPVSYQEKLNTLTSKKREDLEAHIQSMNQDTRGLFNVIINHINKIERKSKTIKSKTHVAIENLNTGIQSA